MVTGQQADLVDDFLRAQQIPSDYSLELMQAGEPYLEFIRRAARAMGLLFEQHKPQCVVVQGDTSSACAGAIAAATLQIPVIHIEAGLRSGDAHSPYPEEALRTLITHAATLQCAATKGNVKNLLREGIEHQAIAQTGNPVVDAVNQHRRHADVSAKIEQLLSKTTVNRRIALTLHRRENFGSRLEGYLNALKKFIDTVADCEVIFPVHPNPNVRRVADSLLRDKPGFRLIEPLSYADFLSLIDRCDLILSDSGGIQEECATIGVPLFILRTVTERPEILTTGLAQLVADGAELDTALNHIATSGNWPERQSLAENPFGDGASGERIAKRIEGFLSQRPPQR